MQTADPLERASAERCAAALRRRAEELRKKASAGTSAALDRSPPILIRSPEAALAERLAADWDMIADEIGGAT